MTMGGALGLNKSISFYDFIPNFQNIHPSIRDIMMEDENSNETNLSPPPQAVVDEDIILIDEVGIEADLSK